MKEFKGYPYPAPWDMRIRDGMAIFDFNHDGETKHYRFAECVVSLATDDEPQDYLMANANLISAAPELLEALEMLVVFTTPTKMNAAALSKAYSAIAKAIGESQ